MLPAQRNKVDISSLNEEEQKLFRLYCKLPKKDLLQNRLKERKYFDSGDYALSKAGKAPQQSVGTAIPNPEMIPHASDGHLARRECAERLASRPASERIPHQRSWIQPRQGEQLARSRRARRQRGRRCDARLDASTDAVHHPSPSVLQQLPTACTSSVSTPSLLCRRHQPYASDRALIRKIFGTTRHPPSL
ncbi:hypothetical protein L1887_55228 [Cichorium endivia]|nr:hypothetical protein L1887_55228 [Cichorium endivia]